MRPALLVLATLLGAAVIATPARAQSANRGAGNVYGPYSVYGPGLTYKPPSYNYGPYSVYGPGLTYRQPSYVSVPTFTSLRAQSSVVVPDGGEALLAGYSTLREGRNEFGVPLLGKVPYAKQAFDNVGAGRSIGRTTVSVRVRVISLAEEEERQTGVRP
jgi:hypothetical protein